MFEVPNLLLYLLFLLKKSALWDSVLQILCPYLFLRLCFQIYLYTLLSEREWFQNRPWKHGCRKIKFFNVFINLFGLIEFLSFLNINASFLFQDVILLLFVWIWPKVNYTCLLISIDIEDLMFNTASFHYYQYYKVYTYNTLNTFREYFQYRLHTAQIFPLIPSVRIIIILKWVSGCFLDLELLSTTAESLLSATTARDQTQIYSILIAPTNNPIKLK